jgi:hypothetical protein
VKNKRTLGVYHKFNVTRTDGSSEPGGKHQGCDYFVLDLTHDKFALPALRTYATACREEYPVLSRELMEKCGIPYDSDEGFPLTQNREYADNPGEAFQNRRMLARKICRMLGCEELTKRVEAAVIAGGSPTGLTAVEEIVRLLRAKIKKGA